MTNPVPNQSAVTRSCPKLPELFQLGEWCDMAGHLVTKAHALEQRCLEETVLIYCVDGRGWMRLAQKQRPVAEGHLFICPAGIPHGYGCDPRIGWNIWWTHCGGKRLEELCSQAGLSEASPVFKPHAQSQLTSCFSGLVESLADHTTAAAWKASELLHRLLLILIRDRSGHLTADNVKGTPLLDLITEDCQNVSELAAKAGYSKYHFCRRFKEQTGRSPWEVVMERKQERAKELLLGSQLTIKEIAADLGFNHPDYFARVFTRHTGVTPSQYRGRYRT